MMSPQRPVSLRLAIYDPKTICRPHSALRDASVCAGIDPELPQWSHSLQAHTYQVVKVYRERQ